MKLDESLSIPCEGIFWFIDNKLIYFADEVNPKDPYDGTDLLHKNVWNSIKNEYKVQGHTVDFDYFPRGRVETCVILNSDGTLDCYEAFVYLDRCIDTIEIRSKIEDAFRLYLSNVSVNYEGQLFIDGSHYQCHNCMNR